MVHALPPSLMPGGFMPRLAAFSLGILMFTTSTLVQEGRVPGSALGRKFHDDHWQYCRATDMAAVHAPWYGRILTRPPVVTEGYHCFGAHFQSRLHSMIKMDPFNSTDVAPYFGANFALHDETQAAGLSEPRYGNQTMQASPGFPMDLLVSSGIVGKNYFHNWEFQCMYQCSKWKTVGLMAVIKNAGTIVAGSAVVVKTSDMISKRFGVLPLITDATSPATIKKVVMKTTSSPGKGRSKMFAAFVCLVATTPLRFSSKIDSNGYYTVDYYVTAVFFSSLVMALVLRQWNPYKMMRIAYTESLWLNGADTFIDRVKHTHRKIDLYEWIHLDQNSRAEHLLWYARRLTMDDVTDEMRSQKSIKKMVEKIPQLEGKLKDLTEKKDKSEEDLTYNIPEVEQALKDMNDALKKEEDGMQTNIGVGEDDHHALVVKNRHLKEDLYCNKYANLIVKTIDRIKVVSNSPPVDDEFSKKMKMTEGITICQILTLKKNAIGTVVDKLDNGLIKVRFPKACPENAPTHDRHAEQYLIDHQPKLPKEHYSLFKEFISKCSEFLLEVDVQGKQDEDKKEDGSSLPEFEDVVVKLEQIVEASQEWVDIQNSWENRQKVRAQEVEMMEGKTNKVKV